MDKKSKSTNNLNYVAPVGVRGSNNPFPPHPKFNPGRGRPHGSLLCREVERKKRTSRKGATELDSTGEAVSSRSGHLRERDRQIPIAIGQQERSSSANAFGDPVRLGISNSNPSVPAPALNSTQQLLANLRSGGSTSSSSNNIHATIPTGDRPRSKSDTAYVFQKRAEEFLRKFFREDRRKELDFNQVEQYVCMEIAKNIPRAIQKAFAATPIRPGGDNATVHVRLEWDGSSRRMRGKGHKVDDTSKLLVCYGDVNFISSSADGDHQAARLRNVPFATHKTPSKKNMTGRHREEGFLPSERDAEILMTVVAEIIDCLMNPENDRVPDAILIEMASDSGEEGTTMVFLAMLHQWVIERDDQRRKDFESSRKSNGDSHSTSVGNPQVPIRMPPRLEDVVTKWWSRCDVHQLGICCESACKRFARRFDTMDLARMLYLETEQHNVQNNDVERMYADYLSSHLIESTDQAEEKVRNLHVALAVLGYKQLADKLSAFGLFRPTSNGELLCCRPGSKEQVMRILTKEVSKKSASARLNRWLTFGQAARDACMRDVLLIRNSTWQKKTKEKKPWFIEKDEWESLLQVKKREASGCGEVDSSVSYQIWRTLMGIFIKPLESLQGYMLLERGTSRNTRIPSVTQYAKFAEHRFSEARQLLLDHEKIFLTVESVVNRVGADRNDAVNRSFKDALESSRRLAIMVLDAMSLEAHKRVHSFSLEGHMDFIYQFDVKYREAPEKSSTAVHTIAQQIIDSPDFRIARGTSVRKTVPSGKVSKKQQTANPLSTPPATDAPKFLGSEPGTLILNQISSLIIDKQAQVRWDLVAMTILGYSSRHNQRVECKIGRVKSYQTNTALKGISAINSISAHSEIHTGLRNAKNYYENGSSSEEEDAWGNSCRKARREASNARKSRKLDTGNSFSEEEQRTRPLGSLDGSSKFVPTSLQDMANEDGGHSYTEWECRQLLRTNAWSPQDVLRTLLPKDRWHDVLTVVQMRYYSDLAVKWNEERFAILEEDKIRTKMTQLRLQKQKGERLKFFAVLQTFYKALETITREELNVRTKFIQKFNRSRDQQSCEYIPDPELDALSPRSKQTSFTIPRAIVENRASSGVEKLVSWVAALHQSNKKRKPKRKPAPESISNNKGETQLKSGQPVVSEPGVMTEENGLEGDETDYEADDGSPVPTCEAEVGDHVANVLSREQDGEDSENNSAVDMSKEMAKTQGVPDLLRRYRHSPGITFGLFNTQKQQGGTKERPIYRGLVVYSISLSPFSFIGKAASVEFDIAGGHGEVTIIENSIFISERERHQLRRHDHAELTFMCLQVPHWSEPVCMPDEVDPNILVAGECDNYAWSGYRYLAEWAQPFRCPSTVGTRSTTVARPRSVSQVPSSFENAGNADRDIGLKIIPEKVVGVVGTSTIIREPSREDPQLGKPSLAVSHGDGNRDARPPLESVWGDPPGADGVTISNSYGDEDAKQKLLDTGKEGFAVSSVAHEGPHGSRYPRRTQLVADIEKPKPAQKPQPRKVEYKMKSFYVGQTKQDRQRHLQIHRNELAKRLCRTEGFEFHGSARDKVVVRLDVEHELFKRKWDALEKILKDRKGQILLNCGSGRLERSFTFDPVGSGLTMRNACDKGDCWSEKAALAIRLVSESQFDITLEEANATLAKLKTPASTPPVLKRWLQEELDFLRSLRAVA